MKERSTNLRTIKGNRHKVQTQIRTGSTQLKALQQRRTAEPPKLLVADDRRRRRDQATTRLEEGGPPTLKKTASSTRRKQRDLVDEHARPSRPHVQLQHHLPPGRPDRARTTTIAPTIPAPKPSTRPLRSEAPPPGDSSPRLHGRPEEPRRNRTPEHRSLASASPQQLHPPPPRPARGARGTRQQLLLQIHP